MLRRAGIVAALAGSALVLAGCGSEKEPTAVVATPASPVPSPSWTPPPAGMWTESDLAAGREVPPEEMDRLRPLRDRLSEPETITHLTEQGAKDAALYYARLITLSMERGEPELIQGLISDSCLNCGEVHKAMQRAYDSMKRPRCKELDFTATDIIQGTGEIPYFDIEISREGRNCMIFVPDENRIDIVLDEETKKNWYTVRYLDGKWTPYNLSLGGRPTYAKN